MASRQPPSLPERILFVRHAQSEWNVDGRWQGQADPRLSSEGRRQLPGLWGSVAGELSGLRCIASSDLTRARRTAEFLANESGRELFVTRFLRERDAGRWTGMTRASVEERAPEQLASLRSGDWRMAPPEGESRHEVVQRVRRALLWTSERTGGGPFAVVSHLGVLRALVPGAKAENASAGWLNLSVATPSALVVSSWEPLF